MLSITKERFKNYFADDYSNSVCIHIRLGDFTSASNERLSVGADSTALPVKWYINVLTSLKQILPSNVRYYVFSDEEDEVLKEILSLDGVERKYYGSAISDMLAMSQSKLIVHTWSTFALWARFLGNISGITYPTFIHYQICDEDMTHFTFGSIDGEISDEYRYRIQKVMDFTK